MDSDSNSRGQARKGVSGVAQGETRRRTLAEKIDILFQTVRRPNRDMFSNDEVATACREATGESFSATYLWQLRTGRRDNPTMRHLEALAQFFGVPVAYFFDDDQSTAIARELELLGVLRDAGVRNVALRALTLSPEGIDTLNDMIDVLVRHEEKARTTQPGKGGSDRE